jgi:hypothetical protein
MDCTFCAAVKVMIEFWRRINILQEALAIDFFIIYLLGVTYLPTLPQIASQRLYDLVSKQHRVG